MFDIQYDDFRFMIKQDCFYCASPPVGFFKDTKGKHGIKFNGLDRRNNRAGYTLDNVVACCKFCNFAKGQFGEKAFVAWLDTVRS